MTLEIGRRWALMGLLAAPLAASRLAAQGGPRIVAIVNNDIITNVDLAERIEMAVASAGLPRDNETRRRLAPTILRGLIDEKLQLQEAKRLGAEATDADVARAFATVADRNKMSPQQLEQVLRARGIDPNMLRQQLRAQVAWIKVVSREFRGRVAVSRAQVDLYLSSAATGGQEEIRLAEIVLPVDSQSEEPQLLREANDLADSLRRGGDFAALAREVSASPTAPQGGDLGWLAPNGLLPEISGAVTGAPVGSVLGPLRTPAGIMLLKVLERRVASAPAAPNEQQRADVQRRLEEEQLGRLGARHLRDLRRNAFIEVRL